jgi:murein DD-endopeptidase MepM/ murein hydrolase activator NlpD
VNRGQLIGLVGSTGNSTGPHTHFELRIADTPVDPSTLMPALKVIGGPANPEEVTPGR